MSKRAIALAWLLALGAGPALAAGPTYVVDPARSTVRIHVGKAGLFKFAGHEHEVVAPAVIGEVVADAEDLSRSKVSLSFEAAALKLTGSGEPAADVPKVQAKMVGPELLDVTRFPAIVFKSTAVAGREAAKGVYELELTGELALHGVTRSVALPVRVEVSGDTLTASGRAVLRHTDYGLTPVSVAGVVKVKNEIAIDYTIVARTSRAGALAGARGSRRGDAR